MEKEPTIKEILTQAIDKYWDENKEKLFQDYFEDQELRSVFMSIKFDEKEN